MSKVLRNVMAGALIALTPVSATVAAVRPNAAVPAAASSAVVAQDESSDFLGLDSGAIIPIVIIFAAIALGVYIASSEGDDSGSGVISRA